MRLEGYRRYFRSVFAVALVIAIVFGGIAIYFAVVNILQRNKYIYSKEIDTHVHLMDVNLTGLEQDIKFLSGIPSVQEMIEPGEDGGSGAAGNSGCEICRKRLEAIFASMMRAKKMYMQIRYIDETGDEIVRVNCENGRPAAVPKEKLQNKAQRYYFRKTMELSPGGIYVSPLDLNVENGRIEIPYKPTIRYAVPVFDLKGKRRGIIIVNVFAGKILNCLRPELMSAKTPDIFLIDQDGYYLCHSADKDKEWGSPRDLNTGENVKNDYPVNYKNLLGEKRGEVYSRANKEYLFFKRIEPYHDKDKFWILVLGVDKWMIISPVYKTIIFSAGIFAFIVILMLSVSKRITRELGRYEDNLRKAKEFSENILNAMPDGLDIVSEDCTIQFMNKTFIDIFGKESIGKKCYEVYKIYKKQCDACPLREPIKLGETKTIEVPGIYGDKTFLGSHTGIRNLDGSLALLEVFRDITELKNRAKTFHYLVSGTSSATGILFFESLARVLADWLGAGWIMLSECDPQIPGRMNPIVLWKNGRYVSAEPYDVCGTPCEQTIKNGFAVLTKNIKTFFPGDTMFVPMGIKWYAGISVQNETEQVIGILCAFDNRVLPVPDDIYSIFTIFAQRAGAEIMRMRALKELEDAKKAAETASRAKSDFLAGMSHELRTPLNAIIGFSEILRDETFGPLNDKQREYLGDVWESGTYLLSLINDVLDLSKVEAGKMKLELSRFSLGDMLKNSLSVIEEKAVRHKIKIFKNIDKDIATIEADERKVKQIMFNLLSNAVKFTPDGGNIGIEARKEEGKVLVSVWDTGIGIEEKDRDKIFMEFMQIDSSYARRYPGTGLGLVLTKKFVELHGGRIWFESKGMNKGTRFSFVLPLCRE